MTRAQLIATHCILQATAVCAVFDLSNGQSPAFPAPPSPVSSPWATIDPVPVKHHSDRGDGEGILLTLLFHFGYSSVSLNVIDDFLGGSTTTRGRKRDSDLLGKPIDSLVT